MLTESPCSVRISRLPCTAGQSLKSSLPSFLLHPLSTATLIPAKLRGDIPGQREDSGQDNDGRAGYRDRDEIERQRHRR